MYSLVLGDADACGTSVLCAQIEHHILNRPPERHVGLEYQTRTIGVGLWNTLGLCGTLWRFNIVVWTKQNSTSVNKASIQKRAIKVRGSCIRHFQEG